ncbi:hypothetical protein ACCO45_005022 [Purpureocillium lilacinum]|uniref:Uncharacterized protein n=1 Tax=Purpureocillium lilacinum TaxID=33203 RepID=A0ACC4DU98_PURLI
MTHNDTTHARGPGLSPARSLIIAQQAGVQLRLLDIKPWAGNGLVLREGRRRCSRQCAMMQGYRGDAVSLGILVGTPPLAHRQEAHTIRSMLYQIAFDSYLHGRGTVPFLRLEVRSGYARSSKDAKVGHPGSGALSRVAYGHKVSVGKCSMTATKCNPRPPELHEALWLATNSLSGQRGTCPSGRECDPAVATASLKPAQTHAASRADAAPDAPTSFSRERHGDDDGPSGDALQIIWRGPSASHGGPTQNRHCFR